MRAVIGLLDKTRATTFIRSFLPKARPELMTYLVPAVSTSLLLTACSLTIFMYFTTNSPLRHARTHRGQDTSYYRSSKRPPRAAREAPPQFPGTSHTQVLSQSMAFIQNSLRMGRLSSLPAWSIYCSSSFLIPRKPIF